MSDIKQALAQLRAARSGEEQPSAGDPGTTRSVLPSTLSGGGADSETAPIRGEIKTLAGRVPLPLHRELTRALIDAADELNFNKINVDEALEAAIRVVLRDEGATQLWYAQLREVRKERREG